MQQKKKVHDLILGCHLEQHIKSLNLYGLYENLSANRMTKRLIRLKDTRSESGGRRLRPPSPFLEVFLLLYQTWGLLVL